MTGQLAPDADRERPKRPYSSPRLIVYGDLRRLTQAPGKAAALVDGSGTDSKT